MKCSRCLIKTKTLIMSMFNTQMICMICKDKEVNHPKYEEAKEKELQQVITGNLNYEGIGLPEDLK